MFPMNALNAVIGKGLCDAHGHYQPRTSPETVAMPTPLCYGRPNRIRLSVVHFHLPCSYLANSVLVDVVHGKGFDSLLFDDTALAGVDIAQADVHQL